jgi:hypothetical protein
MNRTKLFLFFTILAMSSHIAAIDKYEEGHEIDESVNPLSDDDSDFDEGLYNCLDSYLNCCCDGTTFDDISKISNNLSNNLPIGIKKTITDGRKMADALSCEGASEDCAYPMFCASLPCIATFVPQMMLWICGISSGSLGCLLAATGTTSCVCCVLTTGICISCCGALCEQCYKNGMVENHDNLNFERK